MDEEVKKILEKNQEMITETLELSRKMKKYMLFQQVFGVLRLLIIMIPIILSIIYLPPLLKSAFKQYENLLGIENVLPTTDIINNIAPGIVDKYLK